MATLPQAPAGTSPSYQMFLDSARALGAVITREVIAFEGEGRRFSARWISSGKSTPPRLRITTLAGPLAQPPVLDASPAPGGGPFRGEARARIASPAPLILRFEGKLDRAGKWLRLNRETQTGDPAFDERVYLESEAPDALVLAALTSPVTRAGVLTCLTLGCASLELDNEGYLAADLALASEAMVAPDHLTSLLDALGAAAAAIPPLEGPGHHQTRAGLIPGAAVLGALVSWPLFYLVDWLWEPVGSNLYLTAALGGLVLWIASLPILVVTLRGRAVSLRDFVISAAALAVGLPLAGADLLLTVNGLLDISAPEAQTLTVTSVRSTKGKDVWHYVRLTSWHPGEHSAAIRIGSSLHGTLGPDQKVTVTTRRGFLGWEHVISIVPTTSPQTSN